MRKKLLTVLSLAASPKQIIRTNLIEEEDVPVDGIVLGKYAIETYKIIL